MYSWTGISQQSIYLENVKLNPYRSAWLTENFESDRTGSMFGSVFRFSMPASWTRPCPHRRYQVLTLPPRFRALLLSVLFLRPWRLLQSVSQRLRRRLPSVDPNRLARWASASGSRGPSISPGRRSCPGHRRGLSKSAPAPAAPRGPTARPTPSARRPRSPGTRKASPFLPFRHNGPFDFRNGVVGELN